MNARAFLLAFALAAGCAPAAAGPVTREDLLPWVEAFLQGPDSPWAGYEIESLGVEVPKNIVLPDGVLTVDLEARSATAQSLLLLARVGTEEAASRQAWIRVQASLWAEVAVTQGAVERGRSLGPADVRIERRRVQRLRPAPVRSLEEIEGKRLKRSVPAGTVLTAEALETEPLVHKGDVVRLLAGSGGMNVSLDVLALEDGVEGQRIRVKNPSSGKTLTAEVSGEGQARLRLP